VTVAGQGPGNYYASHDLDVQTEAFISSDGKFWGLSADEYQSDLLFKRTTFDLLLSETVWIRSDNERAQWFNHPGYGNIVEVGDYVYIFFWERALESNDWKTVARVARVCKNDSGIMDNRINVNAFSSFVKIQISCNNTPPAQASSASRIYPYVVDAFYVENGNFQPGSPQGYFYAVFQASSPLEDSGPTGSALCVFDYNKVESALNSRTLVNLKMGTTVASEPVNCETAPSRTIDDVIKVTLSPQIVTNEETALRKPLHLLADGERFSRLVVDQAVGVDGNTYEVVFVLSTHKFFETLYLYKLSYVMNRRQSSVVNYKLKLVERSEWEFKDQDTFGMYRPHKGKRMELVKFENKTWLYISSEAGVFRLRTDDCSQYTTCEQCLNAADPHCAFDGEQQKCVSVAERSNKSALTQYLGDSVPSSVCSGVPLTGTVSPTATHSTDDRSTSPPPPSSSPATPPTSGGTNHSVGTDGIVTGPTARETALEWWPFIVGGIVGIFVGIVAGIFLSLFWRHRVAMHRANKSRSVLPKYVSYAANGKDKERKNSHPSNIDVMVEKPNNAVDPEDYHRKESPPLQEDYHNFSLSRNPVKGKSVDPVPEGFSGEEKANVPVKMRRTKSDHDALVVRKPSEQTSSDSAVSLHEHDPNLADSSSDPPGSPITNVEWNMYQTNLASGSVDVDGDYKLRNVPVTPTTTNNHRHSRLSQGSFAMNGTFLNDPSYGCQSPTLSMHSGSNEVFMTGANRASFQSSSNGPNESSSSAVNSPGSRPASRSRRSSLLISFGKSKGVQISPPPAADSFDC
jgi:hypothetical protein